MTCGSLDEARKIGEMLLEKNLAACVNILEGMYSLYRWNGAMQE
ncbi:MAG TPA: divalent cation tolerance protein CutA, partial [SAR324 cluster bacterium]|nr:divalent cation tolerance protein CutA [SAR324 cluster bacterium]